MSNKKKKWWQSKITKSVFESIDDTDNLELQFPNSVKQHEKKQYLTDEYYDDYDDYYDDWNKKLGSSKKSDNKKEYNDNYTKYEKTGVWGGYSYYKTPQLSYKYVQQMANALAGQHNIILEVGNTWEVDLIKKKLTYNPASLIYGTKSELLATLLHEIGKLRYMDHYTTLKNDYTAVYKETAAEVLYPFEDVRVDYQMLKAYESAAELYESALPGVQKQIDIYKEHAKAFRDISINVIKDVYNREVNRQVADPNEQAIMLMRKFGTSDLSLIQERINEMCTKYRNNGNIFEYCADITHVMYDLETPNTGYKNIEEKVNLTYPAIEPIKKQLTSQGTLDIMQTDVFPHVEDLMKEFHQQKEELQKMFPNMPEDIAQNIAEYIQNAIKSSLNQNIYSEGKATPNNGEMKNKIRGGSGPTDDLIPPEWKTGEYTPLKESVSQEIKTLVNKLTFLRREEMTVKYEANQKRGKLNSKKLVKHVFGSKRLFKQKLENIDTIQSFAFSVLIDISGSMNGNRIVHTARALVLFNEVFKKLNIPFELAVFNSKGKIIKGFEQQTDKKIEKSIGGLIGATTGGTNLNQGLDILKIKNRPEKNKIVIVLTDGGVGDASFYDREYFNPWKEKHNVSSIAFGLELNGYEVNDMKKLINGTGRVVNNASTLPIEFAELLKNTIKRK